MANICPTAGIASIVSEQGPVYCTAAGTGAGPAATATATKATTGAGSGSGPGATSGAGAPAGTATAKSDGSLGVSLAPLVGGVVAGMVGVAAFAL